MPEIMEKTEELINVIRESEEYQTFERLDELLKKDPEKKKKVDEFRFKVFTMQNQADSTSQMYEQLQQQNQDILDDPLVREFLNAEESLAAVMREVYEKLGHAVTMDLGFLKGVKQKA